MLTFVACIIGQVISFQFAMNGLLFSGEIIPNPQFEPDWVAQLWLHFLIICVIQFVLMLVIVTLGIIIPALIAMYRKPVNALRYE